MMYSPAIARNPTKYETETLSFPSLAIHTFYHTQNKVSSSNELKRKCSRAGYCERTITKQSWHTHKQSDNTGKRGLKSTS